MALIASISGIRGTIGGLAGHNLTPADIVHYTTAFGQLLHQKQPFGTVVIGRDTRPSGQLVSDLVCSTLQAMGFTVIDCGIATTPTVEMAVPYHQAVGGIILTASHNPVNWNALKLLNERGEFISAADGAAMLAITETFTFPTVEQLGQIVRDNDALQRHVNAILALPLVAAEAIYHRKLTVVVDAVNGAGSESVPYLLDRLGVKVIKLHCTPDGLFPHNPEPLPEHLSDLRAAVVEHQADLGISVDPDADRLALVCETGAMFGEEYTLVAVADYVLKHQPGPTVSNLSSTRALGDVAAKYGQLRHTAAVGEVNVVEKMKATGAVIGGEGNGGVIYPALHYGRDALVGIALFLSHYVETGLNATTLRATYPTYAMAKHKLTLGPEQNAKALLAGFAAQHAALNPDLTDGVRLDFGQAGWVHVRPSNTEPIIRIYTEAPTPDQAEALAIRYAADLH